MLMRMLLWNAILLRYFNDLYIYGFYSSFENGILEYLDEESTEINNIN